MSKVNIMIVDSDTYYANTLAKYISSNYCDKLEVTICNSDQIKNIDIFKQKNIDLILITSELYSFAEASDAVKVILHDSVEIDINKDNHYIDKFQNADEIVSDVLEIFSLKHKSISLGMRKNKQKCLTVGICSAAGGVGKTTVANLVAKLLSQSGFTTAILSFESNQSNELFFVDNRKRNMSGVILSLAETDEIFKYKLEIAKVVDEFGTTSLKRPNSIFDFDEISTEEKLKVLQSFSDITSSQIIIVDFETGFAKNNRDLFEVCDFLILIDKQGLTERQKYKNLIESLKESKEYQNLYGKLSVIENYCNEVFEQNIIENFYDDINVLAKIPKCLMKIEAQNINAIKQSQKTFYNEIEKVGEYIARKLQNNVGIESKDYLC